MPPATYSRFIQFLQEDLAISDSSIAFAERIRGETAHHIGYDLSPLPIILWQYGFVTIDQLDRIFDWLETTDSYKRTDS